jgi:hypothetical protein
MKVKNVMGNEYSGTIGKSLTACRSKNGNFLRKYTKPRDPKTPLQLAQRQKYAEGNKTWRALSEEEKQQYNERGKGVGMNGYCLFMSEFTAGRLPTTPIIA